MKGSRKTSRRRRPLRAYPPSYWDEVSARWDRVVDGPKGPHQFYYREADVLISRILGKRKRVLELGCGTGGSTDVHVAEVARLVATDCSWEMVRKARRRFSTRPKSVRPDVVVCDAQRLPFRPASFGAVFSRGVMLSYVENPHVALLEIRRVLRPRGHLALDVMNRSGNSPSVAGVFHLLGRSPIYDEVFIRDGLQVRRVFRLPATARYLQWARATRRCNKRPSHIVEKALSTGRFEARMFRREEIRRMVERVGFREIRIVPLGHLAYLLGMEDRQLAGFLRQNRATLSKLMVGLADHFDTDTALHLFVIAQKR